MQRRAASVGFDWDEPVPVIAKLREEIDELRAVIDDRSAAASELGDVLFSAVNLARHLGIDAELALRESTARFEARFRWMEAHLGDREMADMSLGELDVLWERAKAAGIGG